ncbi:MAG TPA: nucleotidyltransferase family protein [Bryobacteraceae bacterium]|jgi:glucose-1-phosphate cytidylyltransferase|nr:nucleotidyltransferase family protein [Bryobacteraceae bacterium]
MQGLTAVVLCGGKGERMRPLTESLPKPLIPIGGRPLLEHLIRYLESNGIQRFVLCVGYKSELVEEFARNLPTQSEIICINSGDASMTDRILDARRHTTGRMLVCYGDTLANIDVDGLCSLHEEFNAPATMTVYPLQVPFGIVDVGEDRKVRCFREKPQLPYWINIGFFLFESRVLDRLRPNSNIPEFLHELKTSGDLYAFRHEGRHLTVNTHKDRQVAESEITEFFTVLDADFPQYTTPSEPNHRKSIE